jgi:hypothetical protein
MSCEHLICANCAGPVAEGRCPACRTTRQHVHHSHSNVGMPLLIAGALALTLLLVLLTYLGK